MATATTHHQARPRPFPIPTDPTTAAEQTADPHNLAIHTMSFPALLAAQRGAWQQSGKWATERRAGIAARLAREGGA